MSQRDPVRETPGPTVLLAEPQPTMRSSLRQVLEGAGFRVCAEEAVAGAAVDAARELHPDLCLIEPLIPGGGAWTIAEILSGSPQTTVVVLTASEDRDRLFDAIRAGAAGYLIKDMNPERIPQALRGVLAGEAAIPRRLVAALVSDFQSQGRRRLVIGRDGRAELTRREWEVAQIAVTGADTAEIGARLYLSPVTVRRHMSEIVRKLGVTDRTAALELLGSEFSGGGPGWVASSDPGGGAGTESPPPVREADS